jgi:predicted DNA binding CopG/RHH family protein
MEVVAMYKKKDFILYLDERSFKELKKEAEALGLTVQYLIYYRLIHFYRSGQKLPEKTKLEGGYIYLHLRLPEKILEDVKRIADNEGINLSEAIRRIISNENSERTEVLS